MHRRNHSLDRLAGVIGGGKDSSAGGGGFSYGTTPPLTQHTTQAKLQQEKQKYKERHQHLLSRGEFSQSVESLNQQDSMLTPMSSTSTLSTTNSRTQTYPPGRDGGAASGRRDSSYFPPTPPASIRVASPAGTPRGHAHSGSQQSVMSDRGPTSRSSTPISLNGLFSSSGTAGPTSGQVVAQGGKKPKGPGGSSIRSRFTTLIGGGSDKDKSHGRQTSVGSQLYSNQMQQQQYLQHLLQEEERLQQEDAPLPPLPPPTSPAQREREWADQTDRNSIRRRSVNSVYSETGRRTPTSPDELRRGATPTVGTSMKTWAEDGAAGTRRSGSISTVRTEYTSIVYDLDVDMSQMEDLIGEHSPKEPDAEEDSDTGGGTPNSITPSLFKRNRKELEGTGIATGESTMLGDVIYVDGKLVRVNGSGSAMTIASIASTRSTDNFPLLPTKQHFLRVEDRDPISPLRPTSMQLPPPSPSSQTSAESGLAVVTTEQDPVKRSPSSSSTMSQVKRKPSPVTASFPQATAPGASTTPSTPLASVTEPDTSKPPTPPPQGPLPPPPIITTSAAPTLPNNPITAITSPLTNNSGETTVPTAWGGRMEVSQVELPPPPPHARSPLADSPIAAQYAVERKKKLIDEEWEDLEQEDAGDGDAPPPPYVARMSMLANAGGGNGQGMWEDEKANLIRAEMMHRRSLPGKTLSRQSTLQDETVESLNAGEGEEIIENNSQEHMDSRVARPPATALPSDRADPENQKERKSAVGDIGAFEKVDDRKASAPTSNAKPAQRSTAPNIPTISTTTRTRSNPTSAASSPTVGRKRTILKKTGATPKISPNLSRSNTRNKLRFSHVAPEVVIPPLPTSSVPPLPQSIPSEVAEGAKGKQCKTCKSIKGSSLANKYRELLTRERESFALERSIWEEERKGYEKKVTDLEKRLRRLVEVLARGDEGGDDEDGVEDNGEENDADEEEQEAEDVQPVLSATGGLSLGPPASGNSTRKNSFRDTGKEVDRSQMNQPRRDRSGGSWPRQTGLPTPPTSGAIATFSRPPATAEASPTSGGGDQYWNNFLDEYRHPSRCAAVPTAHTSTSGSSYGYGASSSASSSTWGGTLRTWGGAGSSMSAGNWGESGSNTHGSCRQEDLDPRMKLPITEERAVYARLYAEASIGIGGPTGELLH